MNAKAEVCGTEVGDLELAGVRLDERAQLVEFAEKLLRQGLSEFEVRPALEQFVKNKKWAALTHWARFGIVQSARNAIRATDEAAAKRLVPEPDELQVVSLADVKPEPVRWLWPGKIPLGKVTVVYGETGLGKTCWSLDLAARVSAGKDWPDETKGLEPASALLINGEDNLAEAIRPRLASSGANLQNITAIAGIKSVTSEGGAEERRFDLSRDIPTLRQRIETLGNVRLVIIDSLQAYCGAARSNSWRLRSLLTELGQLAEECSLAVVVISASHKSDLPVKNVWRVDSDVLDPELRWWVPVKCNYGPLSPGLAFRVSATEIVWEAQSEPLTVDRARDCTEKVRRTCRLRDVATWLKEFLSYGPCTANEVLQAGSAEGWTTWQVKRAKLALQVVCFKEPVKKGRWVWDLSRRPARPAPHHGSKCDARTVVAAPTGPVGIIVTDRICGSAMPPSQNPLEWLDRASRGERVNLQPIKESKENKGSKENSEVGTDVPDAVGRDAE